MESGRVRRAPRSPGRRARVRLCVEQVAGHHVLAARAAERSICLGDGSRRTISIFPLLWAFGAAPGAEGGCVIERWLESGKMESV